MASNINFIEVIPEEDCYYCGRKKINENDKFYRVLVGDKAMDVVVCESCKGGFSGVILEGAAKTYATHFTFYVKRAISEIKDSLSKETFGELQYSIKDFELGNYSACLRTIGLVAERLTNNLYVEKIEKLAEADRMSWENKLGRLLDAARKAGDTSGEAAIYQLFSLRIFRNSADHPSKYAITAEDARLGLASILYLLQWTKSGSCRI